MLMYLITSYFMRARWFVKIVAFFKGIGRIGRYDIGNKRDNIVFAFIL